MRYVTIALFITALSGAIIQPAAAQDTHPGKSFFADLEDWPVTSPEAVRLENFRPFRAVYERQYRQASGPEAGALRRDKVIITAEAVGWDGQRAVAITMIDSADPDLADTNSRVLTLYAGLPHLNVLFEIGPVPGQAKDYYVGRVFDDKVAMTMVDTENSTAMPRSQPIQSPGFGPGNWAMAAMDLRQGLKIKLGPYYSPRANPLTFDNYGYVTAQDVLIDKNRNRYSPWVVQTMGNYDPGDPRIRQILITQDPPYYLGTETVNLDTGERTPFVTLQTFEFLQAD